MIIHVVLISLRDGVSQEQKHDLIRRFAALKDAIPGVAEASAGTDFSGRSGEYELAAVVHLSNMEALQCYSAHPAHAEVVSMLDALSTHRLVVDYEG